MSTQKAKFQLFAKLQELGFTYEEAVSLRRIEMTLQCWAEETCNGTIQRDEETAKPFRHGGGQFIGSKPWKHAIADREAGALRRLKAIVDARNKLLAYKDGGILAYHQGDCRGCVLYLLKRSDIPANLGGHLTEAQWIDSHYTRGLAVCA